MNPALSQRHAVVVGLCPHGVALARNLCARGLTVTALESNPSLPGVRTRSAAVRLVDDINSDRLARNLLWLAELLPGEAPALLLTNDRMVRAVARHIAALREAYYIPWARSAAHVLRLLSKDALEAQAGSAGLRYPATREVPDTNALRSVPDTLSLPLILKPCQPLSGMKTLVVRQAGELSERAADLAPFMPLIAQEFVEGPEHATRFAALGLSGGRVVARFEGKKLRSRPLGHTTVAVPAPDDWLHEAALQFFADTGYSGIASLEMKRDPAGEYWVIEPTVGRSDFWVDLCLQEQPDFLDACLPDAGSLAPLQPPSRRPTVWFNSERDKGGPAWLLSHAPAMTLSHRPRFALIDARDPLPFLRASAQYTRQISTRLSRRLLALASGGRKDARGGDHAPTLTTYHSVEGLDDAARALLEDSDGTHFYDNATWYEAFTRHIVTLGQQQRWFAFERGDETLGLLPMVETRRGALRILSSASNYYTPYFGVVKHVGDDSRQHSALVPLLGLLRSTFAAYDVIEFSPLLEETADEIIAACRSSGFYAHRYQKSVNWRLTGASSYEAYLAARPSQIRRTLKRRQKKLQADFAITIQIDAGENIEQELGDYHDVYSRSWKVDEPYPQFISDIARSAAARGALRVGTLCVDGRAIAAQLWFVEHGTASIFKLAYDDAYKAYSPGTVLTFAMLEHVMNREGVTVIDYLTGNDRYKAQLMSEARPLYGLELSNLRRPAGLLHAARNRLGGRARDASKSGERRP